MDIVCFAYPERLSVLLLLLPLAAILGWGAWRKFRARKALADDKLAVSLLGRWVLRREIVVRMLQFFSACFLLFAWCGPLLCSGEKPVRREALDIVYVVDVSNSMLARDAAPDRLERVKREILQISRGMDRGRRGLVVFAGSAVLLCPLTTDRQAFETMLNIAAPDLVEAQGTDVGKALDLANRMLSVRSGAQGVPGVRIVVLGSDGETHGEMLSGEAGNLRKKDIQLIVIGVGAEKPAVIPLQDEETGLESVKMDPQGNPILTAFRPKELRVLAENAKGIFMHSHGSETVSGNVLERFQTIESDTQWVREPRYREEIYQYFVLLSVILLLAAGVVENSEARNGE
ncbi:MAG: VWA domain-containing protein [Chlorobiales bacterium]|nr:VWA domain-containing protein [Chlorobiales bacterium]